MEPAEDTSLEPAIRWLLQSLLASPLIDNRDPWVREAGIVQEMEGLKSGIKGVQEVVSAVKGRALGNDPLAECLFHLKELLYDAEDLVDEIDCCRIYAPPQLQQLELLGGDAADYRSRLLPLLEGGGTHHDRSQADRSIHNADASGTLPDPHETDGNTAAAQSSSMGRLRSKLWKEFQIIEFDHNGAPARAKCIHCKAELGCPTKQGTGVLKNHLRSKTCPYDLIRTADAATNPAPSKIRTANTKRKILDILGVDQEELHCYAGNAVKGRYYLTLLQLQQLCTQHDLDQTDVHYGASQADRSSENAHVPSTNDGLGTQLVERSRRKAPAQSSSMGRLRSTVWREFEILESEQNGAPIRAKCKHCKTELGCPTNQGTGVLQRHLRSKACLYKKCEGSDPLSSPDAITNSAPVATGNLSSKKRKRDEESTGLRTANTNGWNKDDFSKMIQDITRQLHHIREGVIRVLSILGSDFAPSLNHSQGTTSHQRRRTTGTLQGRVYGRDIEKNNIIELMEEEKIATRATVLPILGIAGVGKTTLAQLVYNHPAVKDQFDHMVWIWVSNNFDAMELTKDMLGSVSQETHVGLCNFAKLQEILESRIKSKRVLLVLDDVWDGINDYQWNQLLAPFNSDDGRGNMIILTTRKPCVARRTGTVTPITLGALKSDDFWSLFEACAFGDVNHDKKESLSNLGQQIAQKLKGNPLAAKTAGALLSEHRTVAHWSSVLKNEDWKSLTLSGGIMSALKLCYDQLPYHLQKCFSYCSLFPCNYEFPAEELVCIWISQGFVKCNNSSKRLEEIGQDYLADLVNLGFFEQFEQESSSGCTQICYVMYNLMHDFARVVSRTECATIDGLQCNRVFPTVRHLSIISNSIYQLKDLTGNIARIEKFEEVLRNTVTSVGKLRSLVLIGRYGSSFFQFFQTAFRKAHNLRLLHVSVTSADSCSSLCNLVNPAHLRYLKLDNGHTEQGALSQVLSKSFHLQVLDVNKYSGAWLASLQTVHLDNSGEPRILPSLGRLRCLRRLKLSSMRHVREVSVPSLEELVIFEMPELKTCSCTSVGDLMSSLRVLDIQSCPALEVFDLFQNVHKSETEHNSWLPSLKKLIIRNCPNWHVMIPLPPSATVLEIEGSSSQTLRIKPNSVLGESPCEMTLDDKFLSFHNMRDLKYLEIKDCCNLVSILLKTFGHLISLKSLKMKNCKELLSSDQDLIPSNDSTLSSLESLSITKCVIIGKWFSVMLRDSPTMKKLYLDDCPQLTLYSFLNSQLPGLESLHIGELSILTSSFYEGLSSLRSLSLQYLKEPRLTYEQERALMLHRSLQVLLFFRSSKLLDLPAVLHSLPSLKTLKINDCKGISRLPKESLPPSLEELEIESCSYDLSAQCRSLATGRLRVKIDGHCVN